jgi:hypothetical protein
MERKMNLHSTSNIILFETEGGTPFYREREREHTKLIFNGIISREIKKERERGGRKLIANKK